VTIVAARAGALSRSETKKPIFSHVFVEFGTDRHFPGAQILCAQSLGNQKQKQSTRSLFWIFETAGYEN